ncbi:MAG: sorbosone dehydrogenase [Anaerolineaceae bacterium]|nr:sorbosone dehydrogenase [Anaerolineaceae bacterium]
MHSIRIMLSLMIAFPVLIGRAQDSSPLDTITLPAGFAIDVYAADVTGARSMALGANGTVFVGTRQGSVYALVDADGDHRADETLTIASGLNKPNGVAFRDGALYIAEISRILRLDDIESRLQNPPEPVLVTDAYPNNDYHGFKYIAFGPDDRLYVPVGVPCNVCAETEDYGILTSIQPDGSDYEVYARGIRNTVGFDWHPTTGELWLTDNGRDWVSDDLPPDELNHIPEPGLHFGFPYCHAGTLEDVDFNEGQPCDSFTPPAINLGPHVAPLGMKFYTGEMFPETYHNQIFIAEHGSWNRTTPIGYRISLVRLEANTAVSYETFAEGWLLPDGTVTGRPVDVLVMPDGALLVSDDAAGAVYRISYSGD